MLKFKTVPRPIFERSAEHARAAIQAFAALSIKTIEDAEKVLAGGNVPDINSAEELLNWATAMRDDLSKSKTAVLQALSNRGFLTNSHSGFITTPLAFDQEPSLVLASAYDAFETLIQEYIDEKWVPNVSADLEQDMIIKELVKRGHTYSGFNFPITEEDAQSILDNGGWLLFLKASRKLIIKKSSP